MRTFQASFAAFLWLMVAPAANLMGAPCPPNLPNSPNAITMQGASPDGTIGYPLSIVSACPLDVNSVNSKDNSGTATITADGQFVQLDCTGYSVATFTVSGTFTSGFLVCYLGELTTRDFTRQLLNRATDQVQNNISPTNFGNGLFVAPCGGHHFVTLQAQGFVGSVTVRWRLSVSPSAVDQLLFNQFVVQGQDFFSGNFFTLPMTIVGDNNAGWPGADLLQVLSSQLVVNGSPASSNFVHVRTPAVFKTVTATASGNTVVWTPAAGKKFRLMRYMIEVTEDTKQAVAGDLEITLNDAGTGIGQGHSLFVPSASLTASGTLYTSPWIDLGNGILSAAANNVLNVNLPAALTAGEVRVTACGTEE